MIDVLFLFFSVRHILNVTREIDNFFPGMFNYLNVRVYDDEKTDLLKHWDDTFKYITKAQKEGSKVLVHCKMGVSRSASVVIAYAMKAYNWDFPQAWKHVKDKRNCIKPNSSFLLQLETYQGILDAMKNKEKLQRSKSDTNLKSPILGEKDSSNVNNHRGKSKMSKSNGNEATHLEVSGGELKRSGQRPKSWSPNIEVAENILPAGRCIINYLIKKNITNALFFNAFQFHYCSTDVPVVGEHRQEQRRLLQRGGSSWSRAQGVTAAKRADQQQQQQSEQQSEEHVVAGSGDAKRINAL